MFRTTASTISRAGSRGAGVEGSTVKGCWFMSARTFTPSRGVGRSPTNYDPGGRPKVLKKIQEFRSLQALGERYGFCRKMVRC